MLGILLAILKFIGLLLLGLVLLLLFLMAVVLFTPIKYKLEGKWKERLDGTFAVSWLFGAVKIEGGFENGKQTNPSIRLFGFSLTERKKKQKKRRQKERKPRTTSGETVLTAQERQRPQPVIKEEPRVEITLPKPLPDAAEKPVNSTIEAGSPQVRRVKMREIKEWEPSLPPEEEAFFLEEDTTEEKEEQEEKAWKSYWRKFQAVENKKEILVAVKRLLKRLIKGILPGNFYLKGTLGLGEPALTGYFMGLMGILTAKFGRHIDIKADFTRLIAEDIELQIKGKLISGYFLYSMLAFILTKPVRKIAIKLWKGRKANG